VTLRIVAASLSLWAIHVEWIALGDYSRWVVSAETQSYAARLAVVSMTGVAGTTVSTGFSPMLRARDFKRVLLRAAAGGERDAGDGEADHLTLAAAQATDRVAHEEDLFEI
jgi:hypothetical protein